MKTCKDFNIQPCEVCREHSRGQSLKVICWIPWYHDSIKNYIAQDRIKSVVLRWIRDLPNLPLNAVLKHYYPELHKWYEKMLLLK